MRDWAAAKGRAANKADWDAAFRGWLRRSAERPQPGRGSSSALSVISEQIEIARRLDEAEARGEFVDASAWGKIGGLAQLERGGR